MSLGGTITESTGFNPRLQAYSLQANRGGSQILSLTYDYGTSANNGNVQSQTILTPSATYNQAYTYDPVNRLTSATEVGSAGGWTQNFAYDRYGNRAVLAGSFIPGGSMTPQVTSQQPSDVEQLFPGNRWSTASYDGSGNLLSENSRVFTYDAENRMLSANINGVQTQYSYDGDGRRVKKIDAYGTIWYIYDATGQLAAEYYTATPGVQPPAAESGTRYIVQDALGSTRLDLAADVSGDLKRYDYLPFGEDLTQGVSGRNSDYPANTNLSAPGQITQRFTGKERDAETSLDFFEARYMSSAQGRFMSPDPLPWLGWQHPPEDSSKEAKEEAHKKFVDWISNPQNLNMYAYVNNNPLIHTDPTGMEGCNVGDKTFSTCTITITYGPKTSHGTLVVTGQNKGDKEATMLLTTSVVVGGDGHVTPTGTFTASVWEKDHVSTKYGTWADTPYSKTILGLNAFGPYQLHIKELDSRGIYIHGTMGPSWNPFTGLNSLISPTSHGCVRMCNRDDEALHTLMPKPSGNKIIIRTTPDPEQ